MRRHPSPAVPRRAPGILRGPMRRALAALCLLLAAACASRAPVPAAAALAPPEAAPLEPRLARLVERLEAEREANHVPGVALAVVRDGEVILARGFGLADIETGRPVTPETLFAIGSTTKSFTAAVVATLVDEGRMTWDDPVSAYLPYFTPMLETDDRDAELTLADLLSHRSGFTRMSLAWASAALGREDVLRTAARAEPWDRFRGGFHYNNVMVLAAGEAAGVAAGSSWDELVQRRFFDPLGMRSTTLSVAAAEADPRLAKGYAYDAERDVQRPLELRDLNNIAPAGAINSNVLDMAQWVRLMLGRGELDGRRLIGDERFDELWSPHVAIGGGVAYGLGWFLHEWDGRQVIEHGGNIDGFAAEVALLPEEHLGFVLLCNVTATPLQQIAMPLVWESLLGEEPVEAGVTAGTPGAEPGGFDAFVGRYRADFGALRNTTLEVLVNAEGALAVDVPGQMVYALKPPGPDGRRAFALTEAIAVSFREVRDGRAQVLVVHQGGFDLEAPREGFEYPPEVPLAELEPLLGRYAWPERDAVLEVVIQNNHLAVDIPGQMVFELRPPDAAGVRAARAAQRISFAFETEAGRTTGMVFRDTDYEAECPRLDPAGPLPTLLELHALRRTAERSAAFEALGVLHLRSRAWAAQSGVDGTQEVYADGWTRAATVFDFGRYGWIRSVLLERGSFEASSFEPGGELGGDALRRARHGHPAALLADWRRVFSSERVLRRGELDGRATLEVELLDGDLPPALLDVDAETGDVLRWREMVLLPGVGEVPTTVLFSDYRDASGLRVPFRTSLENPESGRMVLDLELFEPGAEAPPEVFAPPAG